VRGLALVGKADQEADGHGAGEKRRAHSESLRQGEKPSSCDDPSQALARRGAMLGEAFNKDEGKKDRNYPPHRTENVCQKIS